MLQAGEPPDFEPSRLELLAYDAGIGPQELRELLFAKITERRRERVLAAAQAAGYARPPGTPPPAQRNGN